MHMTCLIAGENYEEQLAPFQENNMGDCPEEFLDTYIYEFEDEDGLYKMDMSESIEIVAIHNECPHNGDFQRFMDELESLARRQKKPVRIVCFMNDRLYHHILKRAGWRVCVFAKDALEYGVCNED